MVKTTVYLDRDISLALKHLAKVQERSQAELIREALRSYTSSAQRPPLIGVGKYNSGRGDLAERTEEILTEAARSGSWR